MNMIKNIPKGLKKDLTKDEKQETKILEQEFPEKRHSTKELTKDEKLEPKLEKKFEKLSDKIEELEEHKVKKKRKINKKKLITPIIIIIAIILIIILITNLDFSNKVSITIINNNECEFCSDISSTINTIKESKEIEIAEFTEIHYRDDKAKQIIEELQIKTVPAIVIHGKAFTKTTLFNEISSENIEQHANTFVLSNFIPPITDTHSGQILGVVSVIYLKDEYCKECSDLNHAINRFKSLGVYIHDTRQVDINSKEGKTLQTKYKIRKVPVLLFDQSLKLYPHINKDWELYGSTEDDGMMIMRKTIPPYKDLSTNTVKGLIKVTYIIDKSCDECYDPVMHKQALSRIMPYYDEEETLDINNIKAKELVLQYNINDVPTIILSDDVNEYPLFETLFSKAFEKQQDNKYVFKGNNELKDVKYKDLKTDMTISK